MYFLYSLELKKIEAAYDEVSVFSSFFFFLGGRGKTLVPLYILDKVPCLTTHPFQQSLHIRKVVGFPT